MRKKIIFNDHPAYHLFFFWIKIMKVQLYNSITEYKSKFKCFIFSLIFSLQFSIIIIIFFFKYIFYYKHFHLNVGWNQPFLITLLYIWQCFLYIVSNFNVFITNYRILLIIIRRSFICNLSKKSQFPIMNLLHYGQRDPTLPHPLYLIPPFKIAFP